jgi:hypothetical protein
LGGVQRIFERERGIPMTNEIVLLIDKFLNDNAEGLNFSQADIEKWALFNMDHYYSSKFYFFFNHLKLLMHESSNHIFSFNWGLIKNYCKSDQKRYEELVARHRKANKL